MITCKDCPYRLILFGKNKCRYYEKIITKDLQENCKVFEFYEEEEEMKISIKQFIKIQELFPTLSFEKKYTDVHFYLDEGHYYLSRYGTMWSIYKLYRGGSIAGKVIDLGTNFNDAMENFKEWLRKKK